MNNERFPIDNEVKENVVFLTTVTVMKINRKIRSHLSERSFGFVVIRNNFAAAAASTATAVATISAPTFHRRQKSTVAQRFDQQICNRMVEVTRIYPQYKA